MVSGRCEQALFIAFAPERQAPAHPHAVYLEGAVKRIEAPQLFAGCAVQCKQAQRRGNGPPGRLKRAEYAKAAAE